MTDVFVVNVNVDKAAQRILVVVKMPAQPGVQGALVDEEPHRFFVPPYVGHRGWIGVRLDVDVDWDEIAGIVDDAYRLVAPKKLIAELDSAETR